MQINNVVVTGMGIVSSIGEGISEFQTSLLNGTSGLSSTKVTQFDATPLSVAAIIKEFSLTDSIGKLNLSESEEKRAIKLLRRMPVAVQTTVISVLQAWKESGYSSEEMKDKRIAIIVAGSNLSQDYMYNSVNKFINSQGLVQPSYAIQHFDTNYIGLISEILGIHGEGMTVGGASASGNVAILQSYRMIHYDIVDLCICVGPQYDVSPIELQAFTNLGALGNYDTFDHSQEACRPFDKKGCGFVPGMASGCFILESLESASKRRARIYGEVAGGAMVLDANHLSNADIDGEVNVMKKALMEAKLEKEQIDYLNAHGTSTPSGDATEAEAIYRAFSEHSKKLKVNSTKCLVGHCMYSAGVIEAIATLLQMNQSFLHPNINLYQPIHEEICFVGREKEELNIRYAMSNSFGFCGINTSMIFRFPNDAQ